MLTDIKDILHTAKKIILMDWRWKEKETAKHLAWKSLVLLWIWVGKQKENNEKKLNYNSILFFIISDMPAEIKSKLGPSYLIESYKYLWNLNVIYLNL